MTRAKKSRPAVTSNRAAQDITTTTTPMVAQAPDIVTARAQAGPPCRGRGLWLVVVLRCPHCYGMHQHRCGQVSRLLSGRVDRGCPVTGLGYRLSPVQRRREAVRRG